MAQDFLPQRKQGESVHSFNKRCEEFFNSGAIDDPRMLSEDIRYAIIIEYLSHLDRGNPPSSFVYRDENRKILATYTIVDHILKDKQEEFSRVKGYLDVSLESCKASMLAILHGIAKRSRFEAAMEFIEKQFLTGLEDVDLQRQHIENLFLENRTPKKIDKKKGEK